MTVRMMIKQLLNYPMDSQVLDTDGSPIMYMCFHSRENDDIRLEPKSQMDVDAELDAMFQNATECGDTDRDTYDELIERGFTLRDLKDYNYDTYQWALQIAKEYEED